MEEGLFNEEIFNINRRANIDDSLNLNRISDADVIKEFFQ